MSYLKDLPCAGCGTETTYCFPDKPTAHYCYCEFRFEIGEQIAREIEDYAEKNHPKHKSNILCQRCDITAAYRNAAAIVRGENRAG